MIIFRYKRNAGLLAWVVHRVTGIALTLYLFLHLYVLGSLRDPEKFQGMMSLAKSPWVKAAEFGLLALVAAHALNGARVMLLELGMPTRMQKPSLWLAAAGLAVLLGASAAYFIGGSH